MERQVSDDPVELFGLRIAHIGINESSPEEAERTAGRFEALMGLARRHTASVSTFAGTLVEVMNNGGRGTRGHIGFHVDDLPAAERWFAARGLTVDEASRTLGPDGRTRLVYFAEELAGFALHLTTDD